MPDFTNRSAASFTDHFSGNAAAYASYRPAYPDAFVAEIVSFAPGRRLAWDCATGNGQAARLIAAHFENVTATDASTEQIRNAIPHPRVHYRVSREDSSGAVDNSVELVTVATALHWLDLNRFYAEVRRVLVDEGVVAAWGYGYPSISPDIDAAIEWFGKQRVAPYWPPQRYHLETGFRELPFPFDETVLGERSMTMRLHREQFVGYVDTWSAVSVARSHEGRNPMTEFRERLSTCWDEEEMLTVTWPLYTRIGRFTR